MTKLTRRTLIQSATIIAGTAAANLVPDLTANAKAANERGRERKILPSCIVTLVPIDPQIEFTPDDRIRAILVTLR